MREVPFKHLRVRNSEIVPKEQDLVALERALGCTLPEQFRTYQMTINGGKPIPSFFVYLYNNQMTLSWIDQLYPVTDSLIDPLNMLGGHRKLQQMCDAGMPVPDDTIAIGICGGNDTLLLSVRGALAGSIYIKQWEFAEPKGGEPSESELGLVMIAHSFNAFLEMLCTEEEAERLED